jgi:hypothetical protein
MKVNKEVFFSAEARMQLASSGLVDFNSIWELNEPWFEQPNNRGQGFSGVVTHTLSGEDGTSRRVFIKKQEDHNTRTFLQPIKGIPTFEREFDNIVMLSALGVPIIELLYFGRAEVNGRQRAILVSFALDDYMPVDDWFQNCRDDVSDDLARTVIRAIVDAIKPIHRAHIRHGCLYGKHIFIRLPSVADQDASVDVKLLDFEKAHRCIFLEKAIAKDLSQFVRHCEHMPDKDLEYFLDQYLAQESFPRVRELLQNEINRKGNKN